MNRKFLLAVVLLVCSAAAHAQYKSVAPDGTVTYSDQPPAPSSKVVAVKALDTGTASGASSSISTAGLPYATQQAVQHFPVTIYTSDKCQGCDAARSYLRSRGVPFNERTIATEADRTALKKLSPDGGVPVVEVGRQKQVGFSQSTLGAMLDDARYPADGKLPPSYQNPAPTSLAPAPSAADAAAKKASPSDAASPSNAFPDVPPPTGNAPAGFKF